MKSLINSSRPSETCMSLVRSCSKIFKSEGTSLLYTAARLLGSPSSRKATLSRVPSCDYQQLPLLQIFVSRFSFYLSCYQQKKHFSVAKTGLLPRIQPVQLCCPEGEDWDPFFLALINSFYLCQSPVSLCWFFGRGKVLFQWVSRRLLFSCLTPPDHGTGRIFFFFFNSSLMFKERNLSPSSLMLVWWLYLARRRQQGQVWGVPKALGTPPSSGQQRGQVMAASSSSRSFHVALLYLPLPSIPSTVFVGQNLLSGARHPRVSGSAGTDTGLCTAPGLDAQLRLHRKELGSTWLSLEGPLEVSAASPCAQPEQAPAP